VRYLVKEKLKSGKKRPLIRAINNGSLGRGSIAGDEYLHNMREARVDNSGSAIWVETCFCDPPLAEERPYWEEYFQLLSVKDAHSRRDCRHENGTEPWVCCDCDCTKRLEKRLHRAGNPFLEQLRGHESCDAGLNTSTHHDASICSLITGANAI
jgi:hypothetical protein